MASTREMMKYDVRFLKRELRNARVSHRAVNERLESLEDVSGNARWMHPDGTPCDAQEVEQLLSYHEAGNEKLHFYDNKE